jgi:K+-transporting ATPase ATPase A chain
MTLGGWAQIGLFVAVTLALAVPLGNYMARVYAGETVLLTRGLGGLERTVYRIVRVDATQGQSWKAYARSLLVFSLTGWLALYLILRTQTIHPLGDSAGTPFHSGGWDLTFNTVSSFVTNTNWQYYGGETTLTYFSQMVGLAVENFVSAAVGIVVAVALIRGIAARSGTSLGNFWADLIRTILYVLLPISFVAAVFLVSQGALQNLAHYVVATGPTGLRQTIAQGPVASQEAIKMLGTNGGGFFNVNSAHPFENPNGLTNFVEMVLVLVIPAGLVITYGKIVSSRRQGYAILATMLVLFVGAVTVAYAAEAHGSPAEHAAGLHTQAVSGSTGGNLEGKEQRFGIASSALFDVVTTVTSCGAVNSSLESYSGLGGTVAFANLSAGEVIFGGVGTGLYSMLLYVLLAVFIGGLMVGRTPELLGKKIDAGVVKLVSLGVLLTPLSALFSTALATATHAGRASISAGATGPQGFSETFYAYLSQADNNGSAFAGYTGYVQPSAGNVGAHGVTFADLLGGATMLFARYVPILFALAVAGALVGKRVSPAGLGTMRTDNPTFVALLIGVIVLVGALTFFPALLLGPIVGALTGRVY